MHAAAGTRGPRRVWFTHEEVVQLLVRAGRTFAVLVCSHECFKAIPREVSAAKGAACVAIEEHGQVCTSSCC
jgi:hypothetical protein